LCAAWPQVGKITKKHTIVIGLISDTHGLVRPEAAEALETSDFIIHAGDIGGEIHLRALEAIAPVMAVRGNNDTGGWAEKIPERRTLTVGGILVHVIHDVKELALDPAVENVRAVISGHSHRPGVEERNGVLFINPGSAGPRRFKLPVTVARLEIRDHEVTTRLIELKVSSPPVR
jgi:putative phosphoesterase